MRTVRVVEIDDIEFRLDPVLVRVAEQRIIGNRREVIEFVVVYINTESFGNHLSDIVVYDSIGLS